MNSLMDIRESYFKNKVTSLMMKGSVVKTLNKPPMAKKEKPLEISAKKDTDPPKPIVKKDSKQQKVENKSSTAQPSNPYALQ